MTSRVRSIEETGDLRADVAAVAAAVQDVLAGRARIVLVPQGVDGGARALETASGDWNLALFTSGTTGAAKLVVRSLSAPERRPEADGTKWLLTYSPFRWAGVSVVVHAFVTASTVVVPDRLDPVAIASAAREGGATHVSLTPTRFLTLLAVVGEADLYKWALKSVTFGGEAASAVVLREARRIWPDARIVQALASTEFGDICTADGDREGFPAEAFGRSGRSVSEDGELLVDGRPTGDLWELRGDRYVFRGRRDEQITVGGQLVSPYAVEEAALTAPGVERARAFAVPSPLVGSLVHLEVTGAGVDVASLRRLLRTRLPKHAVPVEITPVDDLPVSDAGKTRRSRRGS